MAITGHLAEFSLAEIFQFLDQGHKTGLLTITPLPEPTDPRLPRSHYVWFQQGRVVAAAHRSDGRGLANLICQRGWLGDRAAGRLAQTCGPQHPLGLHLKTQGILDSEQIKLLFYVQVMRQVCALFAQADGWFHFDGQQTVPMAEMTGLNAPATDVTLAGLRALRDWQALEDKLPDPASALLALTPTKPNLKLNALEWQIWEYTQGDISLSAIAAQLNCTVRQLQQAAFRLIVVGLVEEMPLLPMTIPPSTPIEESPPAYPVELATTPAAAIANHSQVSHSFLQNLMGFLTKH
ncbi:DUF4388 domain-containing protein [Leptolyngbya sp. PCC 6406]|uniref:DUF4388 domain-containing protein n=1 Tax=Leptolyngbya sp. PCC 6406 TaxID=1173264 RepID=UPI0002AC6E0E|nr:DUF4388 domain-containing protein [Leptolyngbya sp. PCC 6406]